MKKSNGAYYLSGPKGIKIKTIIHLSDLHIRGDSDTNSCRYSEYSNVFENLFHELHQIPSVQSNHAIIVITVIYFTIKTDSVL